MILAFEMNWSRHVPFNSGTLQTIAFACPDQEIRVHAEPEHLQALRDDPLLTAHRNVQFQPIAISEQYVDKTQVVSLRRFWREFATLRAALRRVPRNEPCLILLLSCTPTALLAAALLSRMKYRRIAVQSCLHADLTLIQGWRPRNPLTRRVDFMGMLTSRQPQPFRYLVLDDCIRQEIATLVPPAWPFTDVLPHPANPAEASDRVVPLRAPIRVGIVGQATEAKGISPFLATARLFKQRYGDLVQFFLIGRVMPENDLADYAILDAPASYDHLPREIFRQMLGDLHFVFMPLQPGYYNLAASGAVLDAITYSKPMIATPSPMVANLFQQFGDIGYLCATVEDMQQALENVARDMDAAHYQRQVEAMRQVRASRMPEALAATYRRILRDGFGGFLPVAD